MLGAKKAALTSCLFFALLFAMKNKTMYIVLAFNRRSNHV
jgi:hypothetical protein